MLHLQACPDPMAVLFEGKVYCPDTFCSPCVGPDFKEGGDGAEPLFPGDNEAHCSTCGKSFMLEPPPFGRISW